MRVTSVTGLSLPSLNGKKCKEPPTPPKLDGEGEAKLIAMKLGKPPTGFGRWTLQLLADELAALEVVESIAPETVRQTPKTWKVLEEA